MTQFSREELIAEAQRRGLQIPQQTPKFSREELVAEARRRGLSIPQPATQGPMPADVPFGDLDKFVGQPAQQPDRSMGDRLLGAGETALSAATGATGGALGMIGGTAYGLGKELVSGEFGSPEAANRIEQMGMQGAHMGTYEPRTEAGQEYTRDLGQMMGPMQAIGPIGMVGAEQAAISSARLPIKGKIAVSKAVNRLTKGRDAVGADAVEQAALRQLRADELPVPIKLTKGQRERGQPQIQFESETAKQEIGQPLRERFADQNLKIAQNLDEFIEQTGGEAFSARDVGFSVDNALSNKMSLEKQRINRAYQAAEKSGEMEESIQLPSLIEHLNETLPEAEVAPLLKTIRQKAIKLGAAETDDNGVLIPKDISINDAEILRKSINASTDYNPVNLRQASITKGLLDSDTVGKGGEAYKKARNLRAKYGKDFENIGLVKRLTSTKRGSDDRVVAVENVLNEVMRSPVDSLVHMRRLLRRSGEKGEQAWRDVQSGVLQHIRDKALRNMQIDENGNKIPSPAAIHKAIDDLDKTGKLETIFTKKGAEQLRMLDEVAQDLYTYPKGSVNFSNTSSAILNAFDHLLGLSYLGIPVKAPLASGLAKIADYLKNRRTRKEIKRALR